MTLEELNLSKRSRNCLKRAGIHTAEQLAGMDSQELLGLRGLGTGYLQEIRKAVAISGVTSPKKDTPSDGSYLHGYREGAAAMRAAIVKNLTMEARQYRGAVRTGILAALETAKETEERL